MKIRRGKFMKKRKSFMRRRKQLFGRRKRVGGKRKLLNKPTRIINRLPTFLPDIYSTKLRYEWIAKLSGNIANVPIRGNGAQDPMVGQTTSRPAGWDQLALLYQNYTVRGCKVTAEVSSTSPSSSGNYCYYVLYPSTDLVPNSVEFRIIQQQPYVVQGESKPYSDNNNTRTIYMSTKRMYGLSSTTNMLGESNYSALTLPESTNPNSGLPVNQWYINFVAQSFTGTDSLGGVFVKLTVYYYVDFFNRNFTNIMNPGTFYDVLGVTGPQNIDGPDHVTGPTGTIPVYTDTGLP